MHTKLLRQVTGVGPVTALGYVLTLETPLRFSRSRDVGPYLGLVPRQEDSGDSQPQLGISIIIRRPCAWTPEIRRSLTSLESPS